MGVEMGSVVMWSTTGRLDQGPKQAGFTLTAALKVG